MQAAVFLSASIPVPGRGHYFENADPLLIQAAVRALVSVALGRRLLVWGGHPAITPMVRAAAENLGVDYEQWVHLYQSEFFRGRFPEENRHFRNVTYVEAGSGRESSLEKMRRRMLSDRNYTAAVFIGGMEGVFEELKIFRQLHPGAAIVPVPAPGGAARDIYEDLKDSLSLPGESLDFIGLFYRTLGIDPRKLRKHH